jgi:hypothetical protein
MARTARAGISCALAFVLAGPALAQDLPQSSFASWDEVVQARDASTMGGAPLRSLALPGWGQLHLSQRRGWIYLALEATGWALWANRRMAAASLRDEYRDLAWSSARIRTGARQDGDFTYYERLATWTRSGAFDSNPELAGIQPEEDVSTFNGSAWALARDIYVTPGTTPGPGDPAYQSALAYYTGRSYGPGFLWDWSGALAEKDRFSGLITRSDDRFRQATTAFAGLMANHLISAADALVSGAQQRRETPLAVWAEPTGGGTRWSAFLHLRRR